MTPRQKIELRRSGIRSRLGEIAGLSGDALSDEITAERDGLMTELTASEAQLRAAIEADGAETRAAPANDDDAEGAELRALTARSSAGAIFAAAIEHRATDGATAELQQHYRLSPNQVPLAMLRSIETRAVTPAPAAVGQNQAAIIPGVFPRAVAAFLGVDMPMVPVGEAVYPVLTTNAAAGVPNEGAPQGETTGRFTAEVLSPTRLQASFFYSREDAARFAGMDEALRMNLPSAPTIPSTLAERTFDSKGQSEQGTQGVDRAAPGAALGGCAPIPVGFPQRAGTARPQGLAPGGDRRCASSSTAAASAASLPTRSASGGRNRSRPRTSTSSPSTSTIPTRCC